MRTWGCSALAALALAQSVEVSPGAAGGQIAGDEAAGASVIPNTGDRGGSGSDSLEEWPEERVAGAAGEVLGQMVDWLVGETDGSEPGWGGVEVAGSLRPRGGAEIPLNGATATLWNRPAAGDGSGGTEGFATAADPLRRFIEGFPEAPWGKAKVVEVARGESGGWTTSAVVQFGVTGTQLTAKWRCGWLESGDGLSLRTIEPLSHDEVVVSSVGFRDSTADQIGATLAFREDLALGTDHWLDRIGVSEGIGIGGWHGLAVGDADGDGREDLYVCNLGGLPNRLFLRTGDGGGMVEAGAGAGVDWLESTQSALFCDFDNDGDQDLALAMLTGVLLHENDGRGRFTVRGAYPFPGAIPYSLAAADYDLDGDLDLFAACYSVRRLAGVQRELFERPVPYHDAENGGRNVLLNNAGRWRWTHATKAAGLDGPDRRFSYACGWEDYDNDGDPDLYIANDFGRNCLYRNDPAPGGRGRRFTDVTVAAGVEDIAAGMSVAWGDYDNDGLPDLYVGNMFSSAGSRIARLQQFLPAAGDRTRGHFRRHARGNSLFRNLGGGRFEDVSVPAGVTLGRWAWASVFADWNNDGWLDLLVANGFITQGGSGDL